MADRLGSVRISPEVLATAVRLTALGVPGVTRMHRDLSSGVDRLLKGKGAGDGVRIDVVDDAVSVDLHIVAGHDINLYELGREVQARVARAITETIGMPVLAVNVHIEQIESAPEPE